MQIINTFYYNLLMSGQQGLSQSLIEYPRWQEGKQSNGNGLLIVVGRAGHGKSAFVRMIASATEQSRISGAMESKETGCKIYKSDKFADIFGGDIDVMDTPGVQSLESALNAVEALDEVLIRRKGPIVGIAVVLDVQQREVNQDGQGFLLPYLELLKLKHSAKRGLLFCVLTKFDRYYQDKETNQTFFTQFESLFREKGLAEPWERKLLWMSGPTFGKAAFEKRVMGELKQMYEDQYIALTQNLRQIWKKKQYISCEEFQQNYHNYSQDFKESFLRSYKQFEYKDEACKTYAKAVVKAEAQALTGLITAIVVVICLIIGKLSGSIKTGVMAGVVFLGIYAVQKNIKNYQVELQFENKSHEQRINDWISSITIPMIKINKNTVQVQKAPFIAQVECFNRQNKALPIKRTWQTLISILQLGTNRIIVCSKLPSNQSYLSFVKKMALKHYGQGK